MNKPNSTFLYVTYIRTTPEKLWEALTKPEFVKQYWFGAIQDTSWKVGSPWSLKFEDGRVADTGEVLEFTPHTRIKLKWRNEFKPELKAEGYSTCVMDLEPNKGAVKLTITHSIEVENAKLVQAVSGGWPAIMSNLKSLLETGKIAMDA